MMTVEKKPLPTELLDALLADYKKPEDLIGQDGILKQLTKALVERALQAELTDHLGHGKNQVVAKRKGAEDVAADSLRTLQIMKIIAERAQQQAEEQPAGSGFPPSAALCYKCHTKALVQKDGCMTCLNCGDSKCG